MEEGNTAVKVQRSRWKEISIVVGKIATKAFGLLNIALIELLVTETNI
jgi:hypothetical protein